MIHQIYKKKHLKNSTKSHWESENKFKPVNISVNDMDMEIEWYGKNELTNKRTFTKKNLVSLVLLVN